MVWEAVGLSKTEIEEAIRLFESRGTVSHKHFVPMRNEHIAFQPPTKPLNELRVALATSGGVYHVHDEPFDLVSETGDDSLRLVPSGADREQLRFADDHYDHTDADADPNCLLPLDRLRELADEGFIGSVADHHIGFMGFVPDPRKFVRDTVPEMIAQLRKDAVDAIVLSPGCPNCHRTVALAQNLIEAEGISTVSVSLIPHLSMGTGVPRALYVRFPYGNTFGEPNDVHTQRAILKASLDWLYSAPGPNRVHRLPYSWSRRAVPEYDPDCHDGACRVPASTAV